MTGFGEVSTDDLLAEICHRVPRTAHAVAAAQPIAAVVRPDTPEEYAAYLDFVTQVMVAAEDDRKRIAIADVLRALEALGSLEGDAHWAVTTLQMRCVVGDIGCGDFVAFEPLRAYRVCREARSCGASGTMCSDAGTLVRAEASDNGDDGGSPPEPINVPL